MPTLFDPITLGAIEAPNRILMAPLTRARTDAEGVPGDLVAEYYAQRAGAGLIISEATGISREGLGWPDAPGLWTDAQVAGWSRVTDAVHAAGGRIVAQLWHMGRLVHSSVTGSQPVAASAIPTPGRARTYQGERPYEDPRALAVAEIPRLLDEYAHAARNARRAGFDGVQLHAANGYLIDTFLRDNSNHRDDDYGGSPQNRIRLLTEVTRRLIDELGAPSVSVRLSPNGDTQGAQDSDPASVFVPAAAALDELGIGFLELREQRSDGTFGRTDQPRQSPAIRAAFHGPLVLNGEYGPDDAARDVGAGRADAIAFGRAFLANPDLVERLRRGAPLNAVVNETIYAAGATGYTDYPTLAA